MNMTSWGRFPSATHALQPVFWRHQVGSRLKGHSSLLPYGMGRSYGDVCLNHGGTLAPTRALNRLIDFDPQHGILHAEAGVSMEEILAFCVPKGWFPPVTPGTKFVTLGGMVANDVHGKNHHHDGSFGHHLLYFGLWRSDLGSIRCSDQEHAELFKATIGGLGLTGLITDVCFKLIPIKSAAIHTQTHRFTSMHQFLELTESSDKAFRYTVAWMDTSYMGKDRCRGIFFRGRHSEKAIKNHHPRSFALPIRAPGFFLNRFLLKGFNKAYFYRHSAKPKARLQHFDPFFYPLDSLLHWNRLYGKVGPLQYQCVVPDVASLEELFRLVAKSGQVSFLTVLKKFGNKPPPGYLSFPKPGFTLAMDFQITPDVLKLCQALDDHVKQVGGAVYPAKDARMTGDSFKAFFPNHPQWLRRLDPAFTSSFLNRMNLARKDVGL